MILCLLGGRRCATISRSWLRCCLTVLHEFKPRLVGAVLSGSATPHAPVVLHLFADTPESVMLFLLQQKIPFTEAARTLRVAGRETEFPLFGIDADGVSFELIVCPDGRHGGAPTCPVQQQPMQRAGLAEVEALLLV